MLFKFLNDQQGFTLTEVMIAVTILLFLVAMGYWAIRGQIAKGRDSKRKDDLERIRVAFEDYYNDHNCYPDVSLLQNCGGEDLAPYLDKIPCDPATGEPYIGVAGVSFEGGCNSWYKVYTQLEKEDDPLIAKLGLSGGATIDGQEVNYGVSSPNVAVGVVPPTSYLCSSGEWARGPTTCPNPEDYVGKCGIGGCGCQDDELIEKGDRSYYCCPDPSCGS